MRVALLGIDDTILSIAEAGQRAGKLDIVMIDAVGDRAAEAAQIARGAKLVANWEDVLNGDVVEAVLLASDHPERRIEQLRRLVQLQMPTLVSHPICLSMLDVYEIDMIHRESPGVLVPWLPARQHPAVAEVWDTIEAGDRAAIGRVEQITLERFMPVRQRDAVLRQFAQDADLLQYLAGDATKLHALGSSVGQSTAGAYANLNVQLTCAEGLVCRWSVAPVEDRPGAKLALVGSRGKLILYLPERFDESWLLETRLGGNASQREFANWDPAATAADRLSAAMSGKPIEPTWTEAARTIELAETIDRSLAKGRTIDLHQEEFSDIGTFKGTMASVGCGLLMLGLLLVVVVAVLHTIAKNAGWQPVANALGNWPYLLLGVLGVFLLLQLLLLIGKPRAERRQGAAVSSQEDDV